nr:U-box domain-containing protein 11-like [Ipomoea batatas]
MAGGDTSAVAVAGESIETALRAVHDVVRISGSGFSGAFKRDCTDLARRVSLLAHLLEEIRDFKAHLAAKRVLLTANDIDSKISSDGAMKKIHFQFQCVTWKLEKALGNFPYDHLDISEEVTEQVHLLRAQLRRATERYGGPINSNILARTLSQPLDKEIDPLHLQPSNRAIGSLHIENIGNIDHEVRAKTGGIAVLLVNGTNDCGSSRTILESESAMNSPSSPEACVPGISGSVHEDEPTDETQPEENKKPKSPVIPNDFLCPISLELMRDPVIVATGQTYERSYIQRWIDCGNTTCPKTQQKLEHLTLTPNYVLRSLISQWCGKHNIQQPTALINGRIKKGDGSFREVSGNVAAIEALVRRLSSRSVEERRAAVSEIRSLSKRSTDNRILIAEAGAIPVLVNLLTSEDGPIQENAVTSILNLSIYDNNKGLIMLAGAIPSIVQVLRAGSMEARENAAATIFSLSLGDENKIIIGASGAIPALVELLQNGSTRGKKDAATALFNLCIYQGNKGRAVRSGIIPALLTMLTDPSSGMVDEALTILSVLASHQEAKAAIAKANTIPRWVQSCLEKEENSHTVCLTKKGNAIPTWSVKHRARHVAIINITVAQLCPSTAAAMALKTNLNKSHLQSPARISLIGVKIKS